MLVPNSRKWGLELEKQSDSQWDEPRCDDRKLQGIIWSHYNADLLLEIFQATKQNHFIKSLIIISSSLFCVLLARSIICKTVLTLQFAISFVTIKCLAFWDGFFSSNWWSYVKGNILLFKSTSLSVLQLSDKKWLLSVEVGRHWP